jgi:hypothetical protein
MDNWLLNWLLLAERIKWRSVNYVDILPAMYFGLSVGQTSILSGSLVTTARRFLKFAQGEDGLQIRGGPPVWGLR